MVAVLAVYVAEMLLLLRANRGFRHWKPDGESLQPKFDALESEIGELREQMLDIHQQLEDRPRPEPQYASQAAAPLTPYRQAIQLAQQGLGVDEVAASCAISRGEAELIVAMHGSRSS